MNPKKEKKNPPLFLIWAVCPLPVGSDLKPQPIFRPCSLTLHAECPNGFALGILALSPEPGLGQDDLCQKDIQAFFHRRRIHLVPILSFFLCLPLVNCLKEEFPQFKTLLCVSPVAVDASCTDIITLLLAEWPITSLHPQRDLQRGMWLVFNSFCKD